MLEDAGAPDRVVFHCFSGDAAMAEHCARRGWYLSFAGPVTFKNADGLRAALAVAPLERLLVETDAPYLAPQRHRGRRNEPALVAETLAAVATARGEAAAGLAEAIDAAAAALFGPRWA